MNKERVLAVADALDGKLPEGFHFNMSHWNDCPSENNPIPGWNGKKKEHTCGTVGCIGGLTETLFNNEDSWNPATKLLELDNYTAMELFRTGRYNDFDLPHWSKVTPRQASRVLRHLAKTGEVDWTKAKCKALEGKI